MPRRSTTARGKSLFGETAPEPKPVAATYRVNIDGGSRGNPGPAAYGVLIRDGRGEVVAKLKKYIGRFTNNVAEYYGLIAAMDYAQSKGIRALRVESGHGQSGRSKNRNHGNLLKRRPAKNRRAVPRRRFVSSGRRRFA